MAAAARLPGVDPRRLVPWGVSLAGGHVLAAAAGRDDVAAVVSLTPLVDGRAAARLALKHHPARAMLRSTGAGFPQPDLDVPRRRAGADADRGPARRGRRPHPVRPLRVLPGRSPDPTWRNEIDASVGLELGCATGPARHAKALPLPGARADRRLRPQRPAAGFGQGGRGRPRRGAALPVRPLRRLAGQRLVRARPRPPAALPPPPPAWGRFAGRSPTSVGCRLTPRLSNLEPVALLDHEQTDSRALTQQRFERMTLVGGDALPAVDTAGLPDGPTWPSLIQTVSLLRFRHWFHPYLHKKYGDVYTVRLMPKGRPLIFFTRPEHAKEIFAGRPRDLPRRQGQRDPRPGHGRALAAAPGRRRAQARPQAADAGVQRPGAAHLPGHGHRDRARRGRALAGGTAVPFATTG